MKKVLVLALLIASFMIAVPVSTSASSSTLLVQGWVKYPADEGGGRVKDAEVKAECNGQTVMTATQNDGMYQAEFDAAICPVGSTVTVVASSDGYSGLNVFVVEDDDEPFFAEANVTLAPNAAVPEMGTIIAAGTTVAAVGAFVIVRRRNLQSATN